MLTMFGQDFIAYDTLALYLKNLDILHNYLTMKVICEIKCFRIFNMTSHEIEICHPGLF